MYLNKKQLIEKIYNGEITNNDVIEVFNINSQQTLDYILNDGFDFWYLGESPLRLGFIIKNEDDADIFFKIITMSEYSNAIDRDYKINQIKILSHKLRILEEKL